MASSSKRGRSQAFADEQLLAIRLAEQGEPLAADTYLLRVISSVARGLPADADAWDLSGLLVDGQPVSREVVVAWLNTIYKFNRGEPFEAQPPPALAATFTGLGRLLAFGDAVGSSGPVLRACAGALGGLHAHVALGQQQLALETDGRGYYFEHLRLAVATPAGSAFVGEPVASAEETSAFCQQLAAQREAFLHLAHRLRLPALVERLQAFVRANACFGESVFRGRLALVLSERVLDAALGSGSSSSAKQACMSSVLTQPASFVGGPFRRQLLTPLDLSEAAKEPLRFMARLEEDFMGAPKGSEVPVELDLFGKGQLKLGVNSYDVQLLVGPHLADAVSSELVLRSRLGGAPQ